MTKLFEINIVTEWIEFQTQTTHLMQEGRAKRTLRLKPKNQIELPKIKRAH